jgi:lysophospholipase L1-like esterase
MTSPQESGVHLLDFHAHMDSLPNWRTLLCDGLHLSGPGQQELATQLMELIRTKMADIYPWVNDAGIPRDAPNN